MTRSPAKPLDATPSVRAAPPRHEFGCLFTVARRAGRWQISTAAGEIITNPESPAPGVIVRGWRFDPDGAVVHRGTVEPWGTDGVSFVECGYVGEAV